MKKYFVIFSLLLASVLLAVGIVFFLKLTEPSASVQNLLITNITDHQATLTWTTAKATKSSIIISETDNFPFLPFLSPQVVKDSLGFTHQVTLSSLDPQKSYYFQIWQGLKRVYQGKLTTAPTLSALTLPQPVYGRVVGPDKQFGVAGALVYLQVVRPLPNQELYSSALISTVTNLDGRWSLDLGNLRLNDLKNGYQIASGASELVIVQTKDTRVFAETKPGQDRPWPDIILK